jgi:hypothetical protein
METVATGVGGTHKKTLVRVWGLWAFLCRGEMPPHKKKGPGMFFGRDEPSPLTGAAAAAFAGATFILTTLYTGGGEA